MNIIKKLFRSKIKKYGLSVKHPVLCAGGPLGETIYLDSLRCPFAEPVYYNRVGSEVNNKNLDEAIDIYTIKCKCGRHKIDKVYMNMYRKGPDLPIGIEGWKIKSDELENDYYSSFNNALNALDNNTELKKSMEDMIKVSGQDTIPESIKSLKSNLGDPEIFSMFPLVCGYVGIQSIPHLINLLGDEDKTLVKTAMQILNGIDGSLPYLIKSLKIDNRKIKINAIRTIQLFGTRGSPAIPELCEIFKGESDGSLAYEAGTALGKIGESSLPAFSELVNDKSAIVRSNAVSQIQRCGNSALPILENAKIKENDFGIVNKINCVIEKLSWKQ